MATGYTAALIENPGMTFAEFALRCARAFGACIEMRDDPMDKAPPDTIEPAAYVRERLDKAYADHREAEALTLAEAELRATAEYERRVAEQKAYEAKHERETAIFTAMLAQVDAWTPPTAEHTEMKKFMHQQVESSISRRYDYRVDRLTGADWLEMRRKETAEAVTRAATDWEREREGAAKRTKWLRDLRASLPKGGPDAQR